MNYPFSRQKHERPLPASDEPLGHLDADQGEEGHQHRKGEIQHDLNIYAVKLVVFGNLFRCGQSSSCANSGRCSVQSSTPKQQRWPSTLQILYLVRFGNTYLGGKQINVRGAMFTDNGGQQRVYTRKVAFLVIFRFRLQICQDGVWLLHLF